MPFRLPRTRVSLCCKGRDTRLISHQNLFFVMLPLLMKNLASCPPLTLMTSQGEPSFFLFERMGSKKPASSNISPILKIPKLLMKDQLHLHIKIQNQDDFEEFISYNQLMDFLEQSSEPEELGDGYSKFRVIKVKGSPRPTQPRPY